MIQILKTNKIRKYITTKLKETGHHVYHLKAPSNAPFPYVVYDLRSIKNGESSLYDLEVNIWSDKDQAYIEDLADKIEGLLDNEIDISDNGLLVFRWLNRGNIDDPNKDLKRILIKFDMEYFK